MIRELFLEELSLWGCVWQSTLFVVIGLVGSHVLRRRPARASQVLFLAMIAAVVVPTISVLVKHYKLGVFVAEPIETQVETREISSALPPGTSLVSPAPEILNKRTIEATNLSLVESDTSGINIPWRTIALYGWMIAALILLVRLFASFINGIRLLQQAHSQVCEQIRQAADIAKEKLGVTNGILVRNSRNIQSPVIWCWSPSPVLMVPGDRDHHVDWVGVICHELAHWRRWDHVSGLIAELIVCLLPWNPLLWWSKKRMVRLSEQACDDWVVAESQSIEDYAQSLLNFKPQKQAAFVPAVVHSKKGLAGRVRRILKENCVNPRIGAGWALVVSIVTVCLAIGVAFAQTRPAEPETPIEGQEKPSKTLHEAAAEGDIEQVKLNLSQGADINSKDNRNRTALHLAAGQGHYEVAKFLVDRGANVDARGINQQTPLHAAANKGDKKTIELLLSKGANINAQNRWGATPLFLSMVSTSTGRTEVVELLVAKGDKVPAFHLAAYMGDMEKLKKCLQDGIDINSQEDYGGTALHVAASSGKKDIIEFLISKGALVDVKDSASMTPLYYAAIHNYRDIVDLLMDKGADVNAKGYWDYTLLYYAIWEDKKEPVELLIDKGAKVSIKAVDGYSPLVYAIWEDNKDVVEVLINKGADVNAEDNDGYTPYFWAALQESKDIAELLAAKGATVVSTVHLAAATGDLAKVESFINEGTDINARDNSGWTPLHWSSNMGKTNTTEFLIAKGADINAKDERERTPLQLACLRGRKDVAELLIANGADINAEIRNGITLLHATVQRGQKDVAEMLIAKGADVNAKDNLGRTPLLIAANRGNRDVAELLIAHGANVDAEAHLGVTPLGLAEENGYSGIAELLRKHGAKISVGMGNTPLHQAVRASDTIEVKSLIAKGADVNAKNKRDFTPLHFAARRGSTDLAKLLIDNGADVNAKQRMGHTPLHMAARLGRMPLVELLINNGADVNAKDRRGQTPKDLAEQRGHTKIIDLLRKHGAKE